MRPFFLLVSAMCLPFAAGAQSGEMSDDATALMDYAWGFPIEIPEEASFYSVELPLEVNQSVTDPALRDAGVFNGDGSPVSRVFEQADSDRETVERSNPLPMLPLYQAAEARPDDDKLSLQRDGDSMQFKFDLEDLLAPDEDEKLIAYIVDSRQTDDNAAALDLVWGQTAPGFMGRVMVEGGNDLQNWSPVGSAVVAHLREESASIEQRRVKLRRGDFDFLRIRWEGLPDNWNLSQVMGVYMDGSADAVRKFVTLDSTSTDPDDGGKIFDLGGAPVVDQVRVVLPQANTVVSAQVFYWAERREQWLPISQGSYHHIIRNNNAVMSNPLKMTKTRTRQFKVVISRGPTGVDMQLEVGWRPDRLLFLGQGQAPFTLAAGSANDEMRRFPQQRIYGGNALSTLAENNGDVVAATLGPRYELGGPDRLIGTRHINWRTFLLWFGLVMGVAFVGFMATKTIRELRSGSNHGN